MLKKLRLGNRKLEVQLLLIFLFITAILGSIAWDSFSDSRRYQQTESRMNSVNEQLRALNRFMMAMLDTETGQRGYLLTNKPAYLEPYEDGLRRVEQELTLLRRLLTKEEHQAILSDIQRLKGIKLAELAQTISLNRSNRREEALDIVAGNTGKATMDAIRVAVGELQQQKQKEVLAMGQQSQVQSADFNQSLAAFIIAIIVFMLIAYIVIFQDLTERRRLKTHIRQANQIDTLTGLSNFTYLNTALADTLKHAYRDRIRSAILLIDLDNFSMVNDRHGFDSGDRVLKTVANRLREMARKNDVIARLSADRFALVVPQVTDIGELQILADRIVHILTPPLLPAMRDQYLGTSIGIALFPDDAVDQQRLLLNAEAAVAKAKAEGKNRYRFYDDNLHVETGQSEQLVHDLHRAIEGGEFTMHYQPQVNLQTGSIVGVEALVRWPHPNHGNVSPDGFIPTAEKTGLILPLGVWVLREACLQAAHWNRSGFRWRMAVNVSVIELNAGNYADIVRDALHASGLPPEMLELEITERTLLDQSAIRTLEEVRQLGVQISLDDFGTGYSSLSYLVRFPVHFIKIDRSFISPAPFDRANATLVRAISSMAGELGIGVIAEGVETAEQAAFLRSVHCGIAQGHLFYNAMPAQELERVVKEKQLS